MFVCQDQYAGVLGLRKYYGPISWRMLYVIGAILRSTLNQMEPENIFQGLRDFVGFKCIL